MSVLIFIFSFYIFLCACLFDISPFVPLQSLVIYSSFLWSFSSSKHILLFPQLVVTFGLKQILSLNFSVHMKTKITSVAPSIMRWDHWSSFAFLGCWTISKFQPKKSYSEHIRLSFCKKGKLRPRGGKRLFPSENPSLLNGRIRELAWTWVFSPPLPVVQATLKQYLTAPRQMRKDTSFGGLKKMDFSIHCRSLKAFQEILPSL